MTDKIQRVRAKAFRGLHDEGTFVLPNAWDAGSAVLIARAGAPAVGTTSAGVSWAQGRQDGQTLTADEMAAQIWRIVQAVDVPVSADIEGGYGASPGEVGASVMAAVRAGAVGVNVEDSRRVGGPLFTPSEQAERVRAARVAANEAGLPELVVNFRTDVFLFGIGKPEDRLPDVLDRAAQARAAGADCLFVPGLLDLGALAALVEEAGLPVNAMAGPGAPSVSDLGKAGVRRVSVGSAIAQAAYSVARRAAAEFVSKGTYAAMEGSDEFGDLDGAFSR